VRPADSLSSAHPNIGHGATEPTQSVESSRAALGLAICACCHDAAAAPTLAGDRARGPDHIYLVCDRCGASWQRLRVGELGSTTNGPADVRFGARGRDGPVDTS
jgi:hypothetical protein